MEMKLEYFKVFYTFEDISTEYKLKKIKYDADEFSKFCDRLPPTAIKTTNVGFIGGLERVANACSQFLNLTEEQAQQLSANLKGVIASSAIPLATTSEHLKKTESLFLINKDNQIAFIYYNSDPIFNVGPLPPSVLAVDYVRYMIDVCEKIIVIPPDDIASDGTIVNPFQDTANTAIHVQERSVRPNETISISLLNSTQAPLSLSLCSSGCSVVSNICHSQLRMSQDHSRFLYTFHIHGEIEETKKQVIVSSGDLGSYWNSQKLIDYEKAVEILQNTWSKPEVFHKLKERASKIFRLFVPNEKNTEFIQLLDMIDEQYRSVATKKSLEADLCFAKDIIQRSKKESCSSSVREHVTCDYTKRIDKCSDFCRTMDDILAMISSTSQHSDKFNELQNALENISSDSLKIMIHKDCVGKFYNDMKNSWRKHVQKRTTILCDELNSVRHDCISELIQWLNNHTQRTTYTPRFDLNLTFYEINPIIDVEAHIADFKLSRKEFKLRIRETGSIENAYLSQIFYVTDKIGYFNIANFPSEKSSLFYFNFSHPSYVELELAQRLSSSVSKLIVDEKSNIYFIYDNINQRAERGKLHERTGRLQATIPVDNFFGNVIEDLVGEDGSPTVLTEIKAACFLYGSDSMLILDEKYNLIEYRYMIGTMKFVCRRVNEDTHVKKVELRPSDNSSSKYVHVDVIPTGKCVLLQCDTSVDIYDLTWTKIGSIPIVEPNNFAGFKSFADQTNTYVALINKQSIVTVFLLRGLSATRTLDVKRARSEEIKGFPLLDIFYLAQRKFGPPSDSIGCPRKTQIVLVLPDNFPVSSDRLYTYFNQLYTVAIALEIERFADEPEWKMIFHRLPQIQLKDVKRIIETRVPIHIATIEESNMFPLQDGRNITNDIAAWKNSKDNKIGLIQCITELTRIGSYEQLLARCDQPLKIIAIVGRQSGGKSYFLNRMTGTRFNVASTRCTDGIWLSVAFLHGQPVVVLDCEGLFSTRRNDIEEMKLCLTLAAVTDVLLLNQDLSFNRHVTQLFSNFAKSCDRIKGSQLFKGFLMMIIRDVSSQDTEGAYVELISNIRQQAASNRSGYLEKLFGGKIVGHCIHHFENRIFSAEIELIHKMIVDLPFRWKTGREFLESLKLTLAQVHTDDDTVMDVYRLKMAFARLDREAYTMMMRGGKQFSTCDKVTVQIQQLIDPNIDDAILIDQEQLSLVDNNDTSDFGFTALDSDDKEELSESIDKFVELIESHFKCTYKEEYHNTWFTNISQVQMTILEHRITFIMSYVHNQLTIDSIYAADIKDFETALKAKLTQFSQSALLCLGSCHQCQRLCTAKFDHRDDCYCDTDHLCKAPCELCSGSNLCCQLYGHERKHRCNDGHVCGKVCTVTSICTLFCSLEIDHDNQLNHDCTNRHYCPQKCSQHPECDKNCAFDARVDHAEHMCGETLCPFSCQVPDCRQRCIFPNHAHQRLINEKKTSELKHDKLTQGRPETPKLDGGDHRSSEGVAKLFLRSAYRTLGNALKPAGEKQKNSPDGGDEVSSSDPLVDRNRYEVTIDYHVCGVEHTCGQDCAQQGVCSIGYDIIEKQWENVMNTFPYKFYEPKPARSKCVLAIPLHMLTHGSQTHNCMIDHRCGSQCPECRSFCQLSYDHSEPYHHTNSHRNKECNVFVSKHSKTKSVLITSEGKSREYKPGELCKPEICSESCERRGRSHFHLKLCPGEDKCAGKLYPYAKHSTDSWYPYQDKKYDLWLCEAYWHSLGWSVPYNDDVLATVKSCSFFCSRQTHTDDSPSFCTKAAWHGDDHAFTCKHGSFDKLDIVFCCDATGSMSSYITESKKTILRIIEASKVIQDVTFRFVAYRDHPPQDESFVTQSNPENLAEATAIITYINGLTAAGGGDGPEAVLDGLNDSVMNTQWRDASALKYIVHIADSPPHGTLYTNGNDDHWPDGCPCGLTIERISNAINDRNIRYKLMKIGTYPNTMASVFKTHIKDYEETDLNGALDLSNKLVGILARDLHFEEVDVIV